MRIALYNTWSQNNKALADMTRPNHAEYAKRHGYTHLSEEIPFEEMETAMLQFRALLDDYDAILTHGSDVLFMTQTIPLESLPGRHVTCAQEMTSWFPINNDVMLWRNTDESKWLLDKIIIESETWLKYEWFWQTHLWNLIVSDPIVRKIVCLVHPRLMNSTHQPGPSKWQLGQFIIHFLGYSIEDKIKLARGYLPLAGDGTLTGPRAFGMVL